MGSFDQNYRPNDRYGGPSSQAPARFVEPAFNVRALTRDAYALTKRGEVNQALSLLEDYELSCVALPDFWKCYLHCLFKWVEQESQYYGQDANWLNLFAQRMQRLESNSCAAGGAQRLEDLVSGSDSFSQYLLQSLNALRSFATNPQQGILLQQARAASKSKNYQQALALYKRAQTFGSLPKNDVTSLRWGVYHQIKAALASNRVRAGDIFQLFLLYLNSSPQPEPGPLHSLLLWLLDSVCRSINTQNDPQKETVQRFSSSYDFNAALLLQRMDILHTLNKDDLAPSHGADGTEYEALGIKLLRHVAKFELNRIKMMEKKAQSGGRLALSAEKSAQLNYLCAAMQKYRAFDHSDNRIWFDYYYAKLLYCTSRYEEAKEAALTVIASKSTEYWMWEFLAQCYAHLRHQNDDAMTKSAQYFAKAIMCCPQSSVLPALYDHASWVFNQCGYRALAQFMHGEAHKENAAPWAPRANHARLFVGSGEKISKASSEESLSESDVQELLAALASEAEVALCSELPWRRGNLGEVFTPKARDHNQARSEQGKFKERPRRTLFVAYPEYELPLKIVINDEPPLSKLPLGTPLEVRLEQNGVDAKNAPRFSVRQIRVRTAADAATWDLMPLRTMVITKVDQEAKKYHFRYNREIHGTLPFNLLSIKNGEERIELPLKPGAAFTARLVAQPRSDFVATICINALYPTNRDPLPEALKYVRSDD